MTVTIGTVFSSSSTKVMLLGSGELGKELAIEFQRLGVEVIAVDNYSNAPAMQVAHRSYVIDMTDELALSELVQQEHPNYIVPEVEAIATAALVDLEKQGFCVVPTARATQLTMNREGIRLLAAETLQLPTSVYQFADSYQSLQDAIDIIGLPCIIKPIMSSSGKGQSIVRSKNDISNSWQIAQEGARVKKQRVMVEQLIDFEYEITLLTVRHRDGTHFCEPIGHIQKQGDYQISWQPQLMSPLAKQNAIKIAREITDNLGGYGVYGVELFVKGDQVWFNEVSPRPHDTGLVTLISQNLSEFALHVRAILGLPIPQIKQLGPSASYAILVEGHSRNISYQNLNQVLSNADTQLRLFGKPNVAGKRRMGVMLAQANTIEAAKHRVLKMIEVLEIKLQ